LISIQRDPQVMGAEELRQELIQQLFSGFVYLQDAMPR